MHIERLQIKNFRCFEQLDISFERTLTVIVAENGQGKSSLLDAIRVGLWPFIKSFDLARASTFNDPSNSIAVDDCRITKGGDATMARQLPVELILTGEWEPSRSKTWKRYREKELRGSKTIDDAGTNELKKWAATLQDGIRGENASQINLPVFGYYGTGRLWAQKQLLDSPSLSTTEESDFYMRSFGYRNCMDPASSYKHFKAWFIWAWESRSNMQMRTSVSVEEKELADRRIKVVQGVINAILQEATGWHTLEYSVEDQKSLILNHDTNGRITVDYLSDGIRSMLALAGDIAYRCIKLNPQLAGSAALETTGVVLIDEVDMHLHPRWQQLVLGQLQQAFPKIQFIVTTHSPQVLSTVKPESIRGLKNIDGRITVVSDYQFSEGAETQIVLEDILGVSPRAGNLQIVQKLEKYLRLIVEDQWDTDEAKSLREELDVWGHGHETALLKADMDIRMRQFRRGKAGV